MSRFLVPSHCCGLSLRLGTILIGFVGIIGTSAYISVSGILLHHLFAEEEKALFEFLCIVTLIFDLVFAVPYLVACFPLIYAGYVDDRKALWPWCIATMAMVTVVWLSSFVVGFFIFDLLLRWLFVLATWLACLLFLGFFAVVWGYHEELKEREELGMLPRQARYLARPERKLRMRVEPSTMVELAGAAWSMGSAQSVAGREEPALVPGQVGAEVYHEARVRE